jgi:hypothetical protein
MTSKKSSGLPARLEATRQRFERWRRTQKGRRQIPDPLWNSAVKMAGQYGIHRTAKALRLDYYSLKERLEQGAAPSRSVAKVVSLPPFLELGSAGRAGAGAGECILEVEDGGGAKMRVYLKGIEAPDLTALSRSLWGGAS